VHVHWLQSEDSDMLVGVRVRWISSGTWMRNSTITLNTKFSWNLVKTNTVHTRDYIRVAERWCEMQQGDMRGKRRKTKVKTHCYCFVHTNKIRPFHSPIGFLGRCQQCCCVDVCVGIYIEEQQFAHLCVWLLWHERSYKQFFQILARYPLFTYLSIRNVFIRTIIDNNEWIMMPGWIVRSTLNISWNVCFIGSIYYSITKSQNRLLRGINKKLVRR